MKDWKIKRLEDFEEVRLWRTGRGDNDVSPRLRRGRTAFIYTLGCKANKCDSVSMEDSLKNHGYTISFKPDTADVLIVNTCTVTGNASYQSRQMIRRLRRMNPDGIVVAAGCYPQVDPEEVARVNGVSLVIGIEERERIGEILDACYPEKPPFIRVGALLYTRFLNPPYGSPSGYTRAFLKVQDGCDQFCSFCIVPYARGIPRSLPINEVLLRIKELSRAGFKEVVLTGIHIGSYGKELQDGINLLKLMQEIEKEKAIERVRISSLDPQEISMELIELMATSRIFCDHLHIPLQSGNKKILNKMRRLYTPDDFAEIVLRIRERLPLASIGVDVIAGFPGEGEQKFLETYRLISSLPVTYLHVFPFSKRKGTDAEKMGDQVHPPIIRERALALRELGRRKRMEFYKGFIGQRHDVIVERKRDKKSGLLNGYSRNYLKFSIDGPDSLMGRAAEVFAKGITEDGFLKGVIL